MNAKIGFIGCGNMGGALLRAVLKKISAENILAFDVDSAKTEALAQEYGVIPAKDVSALVAQADYVVLGVKPQVLDSTLASLKDALNARKSKAVLVSMAAGVSIAKILALVGEAPVIRIMPNTPASVGEGVILWDAHGTTEEQNNIFREAFSLAGILDRLEEKYIDAASALSGCGPAFVCLFAEALADGAVACGLPRKNADLYAAQTLLGTAKLILESGKHPGVLKDAVCSPGGTTIEGVRALEEGALRGTVMDAVVAAYEKTLALGK